MEKIEKEKASSEKLMDYYHYLQEKIDKQLNNRKQPEKDENPTPLEKLVELLELLPALFLLGIRILLDKEVPPEKKGTIVGGIAYIISPIDLIPDALPVAGWIDDLIVIALAIGKCLQTNDEVVTAAVQRHWVSEADIFDSIKQILAIADTAGESLPTDLMKIIRGMFTK